MKLCAGTPFNELYEIFLSYGFGYGEEILRPLYVVAPNFIDQREFSLDSNNFSLNNDNFYQTITILLDHNNFKIKILNNNSFKMFNSLLVINHTYHQADIIIVVLKYIHNNLNHFVLI